MYLKCLVFFFSSLRNNWEEGSEPEDFLFWLHTDSVKTIQDATRIYYKVTDFWLQIIIFFENALNLTNVHACVYNITG